MASDAQRQKPRIVRDASSDISSGTTSHFALLEHLLVWARVTSCDSLYGRSYRVPQRPSTVRGVTSESQRTTLESADPELLAWWEQSGMQPLQSLQSWGLDEVPSPEGELQVLFKNRFHKIDCMDSILFLRHKVWM